MTPLQLTVVAILDRSACYEWSVQGFGMLRLYIRSIGRLHIWDSLLRYPGVSLIHNHSWDLRSTVVSGKLKNTIYGEHRRGLLYDGKRLITGYAPQDVQSIPTTRLGIISEDEYWPGDEYEQGASVIHQT